ncbi:hypothetical protein M9H77_18335 [Catharanthus roseus]|uniref:Uncharacterized protein n=1 Tax=Catharanthus roseus TaxID=4058 RepID=A0ACC0B7C3_CATRO|nr:hypothetical protein M9H77_18335 [Catharanthus roseus]
MTPNSLSGNLTSGVYHDQSKLRELFLSDNLLEGTIPPKLSKCNDLEQLSLSSNQFSDRIPRELGFLSKLKVKYQLGLLILSTLNLWLLVTTTFLAQGSSLLFIDMSSYRLSVSLPSTIWVTLANLQEIYLFNNKLSARIPSFFCNASSLVILDLSSNSFSGPVPTTIGNLRFLKRLLIAENNMTREPATPELTFIASLTNCRHLELVEMGTIPSEIGNLRSMEAIYLGSNELTGSIPTELCQLPRLERLYLDDKMLNGSVPDC